MKKNINTKNIHHELAMKTFTIYHKQKPIEVIFDLDTIKISQKVDEINFKGVAKYTLDTEFAGGPVSVEIDFSVIDGKVKLDFSQVPYKTLLNWKEIEKESHVNYAYIDDEDDEIEENFYEQGDDIEDEDYEIFDHENESED